MNKGDHVFNAVLLSIGISVLLHPGELVSILRSTLVVGVPLVIGVLFPDIDTVYGVHRKTFHNLPVLIVFIVFPIVFGNLYYVWIGVLSHYILDYVGTKRGIALLYPYPKLFESPFGVPVNSRLSSVVTVLITVVELAVLAIIIDAGYANLLSTTGMVDIVSSIGVHLGELGVGFW